LISAEPLRLSQEIPLFTNTKNPRYTNDIAFFRILWRVPAILGIRRTGLPRQGKKLIYFLFLFDISTKRFINILYFVI